MNETTAVRPEEEGAAERLKDLLRFRGHEKVSWEPGTNPPDLDFRVDGERWAVEVTRIDAQVRDGAGSRSREDADTKLMNFGRDLRRDTSEIRNQSYTLFLPRFPAGRNWSRWKNRIRKKVIEFIESDESGSATFEEGSTAGIYAYGPGDKFLIVPLLPDQVTPAGNAHYDIAAVQEESLDYALADKAKKMARLSGYQKKALILINRYFFGDDPGEAQRLLKKLMPSYGVFDLVFLFEASRGLSLVYAKPSPTE